ITAVMLELVQGEGGIVLADNSFINELFDICNKKKILTVVDEVQTGLGRTGKVFSYQHYNIKPDIITMAKGLGGGVPIGAIHARENLMEYLSAGSHGCTFGGNHLACAAASVILETLKKGKLLLHVDKVSQTVIQKLNEIKNKTSIIKEIRGIGLHVGFELKKPGFDMVKKALKKGLIINCTAEKVIRIMPPLNIPLPVVKAGMKILEELIIEEDI
ncbi:aminotransferase class III-fold pyridoxal phosphate-dependent enzyme, partial [Spirochaetota bacterium]